MYTIGQFSLITKTSKKTLRHYDDIGLLKPAKINENLYRYYNDNNLEELKRITELKSYGLPLAQIIQIIKTEADLEGILKEQLNYLSKEIDVLKHQQENLVARLNDKPDKKQIISVFPVERFTFENADIISVTHSTVIENIGNAIGKFYEYVGTNGISLQGEPMVHLSQKDDSEVFDLEVFAYIKKDSQSIGRPLDSFCPLNCLRTSYKGFDNREKAYKEIFKYAQKYNLTLGESMIEKYSLTAGGMLVDVFVGIVS